MTTPLLLVIGRMRSGTSILAQCLHRLGLDMGMCMVLPPPGTDLAPEWEDPFGWLLQPGPPIAEYLDSRLTRWRTWRDANTATLPALGIKSPLLTLGWRAWMAAAKAAQLRPITVLVERDDAGRQASLAHATSYFDRDLAEGVRLVDERIAKALPAITPDETASWEELTVATALAATASRLLKRTCGEVVDWQVAQHVAKRVLIPLQKSG